MGDYSLIDREHLENMLRETNRDNAYLDKKLQECEENTKEIKSKANACYQRAKRKGLVGGKRKTRRKRRRKKKRKTRKRRKTKRRKRKKRSRKKKGGVYIENFYDSERFGDQFLKLYKNRTPIVVGEGVFDSFANRNSDGKRIIKIDITPDAMRPTLKQFLLEDFDDIIIVPPGMGRSSS